MAIDKQAFSVGDVVHGFTVTAATPLPGQRAVAYQCEHQRTGARFLHLATDDEDNVFSVVFPTPPADDTGVPHILEHSVLAGSQKFPVREPFFEMHKSSMATFINAMTGFDVTYYPVSSNVKTDLFNLADVYFDAVFHPLLTEHTFEREGHHLAPAAKDDPTGALTRNGIVFNEMKAGYSRPDILLMYHALRQLCPDTCYRFDSGGDPQAIPTLTHEGLCAFHAHYYHPSNAYIICYGDIPTEEFLAFLAPRLDDFTRTAIDPVIARQPAWDAPRSYEERYPVGAEEDTAAKTFLMLGWLIGDGTNPENEVLLTVLNAALLGNQGAPLRKAIIDSGLAEDIIFSGNGSIGREQAFIVSVRGSEPERLEAFEALVLRTLAELAETPLPREGVEAAFQQAAYNYREINGYYPLSRMYHVVHCWIYDTDPLAFLQLREQLDACQAQYARDPLLFNRLLKERLLENPHRLRVTLRPDRALQAQRDAEEAAALQQVRAGLSEAEVCAIAAEAEALDQENGTPNTPEQLALLPQFRVRDLPQAPRHIPTSRTTLAGGTTLLRNDVFANGISYLQLDFDLCGLPAELWPYLPRYQEAINKMGAAGQDYTQIARRIAAATGGIYAYPTLTTHAADAHPVWGLRLGMKMLDEQAAPALAVLHDLLFTVDPRDAARLRDVLTQSYSQIRNNLVYNGSSTAGYHAERGLSVEGYLNEQLNGLTQLALVTSVSKEFDAHAEEVMSKVEAIRDFLLVRGRVTASFTGSDRACATVQETLEDWLHAMAEAPIIDAPLPFTPYATPPCEGLAAPIQVANCAQMLPFPHASDPDEPLLRIGAHILSNDYCLSEIRLKGNAYGAWCYYDGYRSVLNFGSYADPQVARTLGVFAGAPDYIRGTEWTQADIDRSIIGVARNDARPIRPDDATRTALQRHLIGLTPERREEGYRRLLAATPATVKRRLLAALDAGLPHAAICVVANREKLEEANKQRPGCPLEISNIAE